MVTMGYALRHVGDLDPTFTEFRRVVQPPVVRPDGTYVPTLVKGENTPEVHVAWVVEAGRTPMRIVDVVAEGMSLRLAKRSDFTAYLTQHDGDVAGFLAALERQTAR